MEAKEPIDHGTACHQGHCETGADAQSAQLTIDDSGGTSLTPGNMTFLHVVRKGWNNVMCDRAQPGVNVHILYVAFNTPKMQRLIQDQETKTETKSRARVERKPFHYVINHTNDTFILAQ